MRLKNKISKRVKEKNNGQTVLSTLFGLVQIDVRVELDCFVFSYISKIENFHFVGFYIFIFRLFFLN